MPVTESYTRSRLTSRLLMHGEIAQPRRWEQNIAADMHIVPPNHEIADLERQALEYEKRAETEPEPEATRLREAAEERRAWVAQLKSGRWHP